MLPFLPLDGAASRTRADKRWVPAQMPQVAVYGFSREQADELLRLIRERLVGAVRSKSAADRYSNLVDPNSKELRRNALTLEKDELRKGALRSVANRAQTELRIFDDARDDAFAFLTCSYESGHGIPLYSEEMHRKMYTSVTDLWRLMARNDFPIAQKKPDLQFGAAQDRLARIKPFFLLWEELHK